MKIFLDANIIFSASKEDSLLGQFIKALRKQKLVLVTNPYALDEARRNIQIHFPERLSRLNSEIEKLEIVSKISIEPMLDEKYKVKEKDLPILLGAIANNCDFLLTGDKRDFGHLFGKAIRGTVVVSPKLLAEKLKIN